MLSNWIRQGEPYYAFMHETSQHIVYISDIGATSWGKPIFITTSAVMVVLFDLTFLLERWQRHRRQLAPNYRRAEKVMSALAIFWSLVGGAGLVLLTIFDTAHHQKVHDGLLGVFIAGYVISAICVCVEYALLGLVYRKREHALGLDSHRGHRILLASFVIKACFIVVELGMAIAFGVTEYMGMYNTSAILEWIVALIYIFCEFLPLPSVHYLVTQVPGSVLTVFFSDVWSYIFDFLPVNYAVARTRTKRFPPTSNWSDEMTMTERQSKFSRQTQF